MMNKPPSWHMICVGIESSFITYFLASEDALNLSFDICRDVEDAYEKISLYSYDIAVIGFSMPETSVLELIKTLREKGTKKAVVAVVTEKDQEERCFRLKEENGVDFILQTPLIPKQVNELLASIKKSDSIPTTPLKSNVNVLDELKHNYEKTITSKIDQLIALVKAVQQKPDKQHAAALQVAVHKMGGSAGSYGYAEVSVVCKVMDKEIDKKIASESIDDALWLSSLDEFIQNVKHNFSACTVIEPSTVFERLNIPRPLLYVVDDDVKFLKLLKRLEDQFSMELEVDSDPHKALERLSSSDFNPNALVVSQTFQASSMTGFDLIKVLKDKRTQQPTVFCLFLEQDSIDARIELLQKGIDYVFCKPVSGSVLLKTVQDIFMVQALNPLKVLVVDDDIDFCNFVTAALSEVGISVKTLQDSVELFKTLEEFKPNVLLLDLKLPKYDGFNLLKTLRQDVTYHNLIIILVTSGEGVTTRNSAYSAHADDILFKPFDKVLLQKRILSLEARQTSSVETANVQDEIGLFNQASLMTTLHEILRKSSRTKEYLVLFEIHHFDVFVQQQGNVVARRQLVSISNQLQWEMDLKMQCFTYNSSVFAVVFDESNVDVIENRMNKFLTSLVQDEKKYHFSFDCSIVPISKEFGGVQQILQTAEHGLREASKKSPAPVQTIILLPKGESIAKRELLIVDSDRELLKMLKQAFEFHGIVVNTYAEGSEALKMLLSCTENRLPSLIIVERKLPDMDGMDIYLKLKERFKVDVPFYILTLFSSDKDVSEGIEQGILEYIVKPFNISLLVQKVLKAIS